MREWITSLIINHQVFRTKMFRNILRFPYGEFEFMLLFLQLILLRFFSPGLRKPPAHGCYYQRIPGRTFFARSSIKDKIERGFSSISYGIFVPNFFIYTGVSANVRQVPIDGLGLKLDMFFVREFPQLLLIILVLILVLALWRSVIINETHGNNIQMGCPNDLMILCLGLITLALGIF